MAMAPEQVGIGIRRHFTRAGVHPYETVTWEKRDARIPNYKSGGDAFFQPGVEFPTTWSQNATNIVAQKYFRGQLGTEARESSLRQVMDRVSDTISDWGVRDGYFVDEAEADAFRDELKYLLVHQRAAFNSPVWFNIGVKGVPAQASACQPYHALVSTVDGLVPIGRLVEDDAVGTKVLDAHGLTSIVAVKANGTKPVLRLHTKAGYTLDVTPDHLVWRVSGFGTGRFVKAGELQPGDKLEWHRTESWGAGSFDSSEIAEAALAGWLQSDGFVGQYEGTNRSLTIEAMTVTPAELDWVTAALDKVFPDVHRHERAVVTRDQDLDCRRTRLYGRALADFVAAWRLRDRGVAMEVRDRLFTAPLPVVVAYLRSIFQAEGYVSIRERAALVGLDMISEGIVRGVQQLLLRFGIFSRIRFKADSRADRKGCWSLSIGTAGDRRRFADEIGFIDPRKAEKLEASFDLPNGLIAKATKALDIDRIEDLGDWEVFDIQTESGEYLSGNLRVHNCFILAVDDTMPSILNWYVEEGTIFKGGSGSGINLSNIRSSAEALAGGGTASGPVSFMRGADASAGTIKCLHADTELVTDHGSVPIRSVAEGWQVLTRHGFRTVTAVHDNGVRPLVRVRTALGDEIACTPEHRFRVRTSQGEMWRQAGELGPDDYVVVDLAHTDTGSPQRLEAAEPGSTDLVLPEALDEAFAVWLGWAHGEGRLRPVEGSGALAVHLDGEDKALVERYRAFTTSVFGHGAVAGMGSARGGAAPPATLCAPSVARFLRDNGLWRVGAASVPRPVRSSPAAVRSAFLAGLFESDGHVQHGCPTLWTRRRGLALDVHRLLLSIGIPSKVSQARPPASAQPGGSGVSPGSSVGSGVSPGSTVEADDTSPGAAPTSGPGLWRVRVVGAEGVRRFAKLVGFVSEGKARLLETALEVSKEEPETFESTWFFPHVDAELDHLGFGVSASLRAAIGSYRHDSHPYGMSLPRAAGIAASFPAELEGALARFAQAEELYVPVTVEPAGEGPTFDLTVEDVHEYLVHSVVTHNSGGKTRRAAKMVILNADHPDIESFIWCKTVEERKARALAAAGFDMDLDGADSHSTQYQNANNSVRVTDEFMQAVVDDDAWDLNAVTTGEAMKTMKARALLRQIAQAAWECADPGMQFDTTINRWHTASNTGRINASNPCSEYMHIDNSACNLASLNLMKFLNDDDIFDVEGFKAAVEVIFTAQEILVGNADYPTSKIAENSRAFRQLGIGYANLGALLMAQGLPYDSDKGRALAGAITSVMTGHAYATSARTAGRMGPFAGYGKNKEPMLNVLRMHRAAVDQIDPTMVPAGLIDAARGSWDDAVEVGEVYGVRNSQASVLAPTGTIGLMMDCDTTGVEPDLALTKAKKLVGGGTMFIVNQTVPRALRRLGYSDEQNQAIIAWIDEHKTILGAPALRVDDLPVFACAMGDNVIHYMGHVRMMAAVQPFISGAISKCVVGETLLSTADGLVRIGSLHRGEPADSFRDEFIEVASLGGTHKTDAFYYGGLRPVREAVLRSGHRVVGTPNHRVLVAGDGDFAWRRLDEIEPGDHVAVRYGAEMWSTLPARFDGFRPAAPYGCQKRIRLPEEMSEELAFLLGAYVAEGHTTRATWTVTITNSVPEVLERVAAAWRSLFGVEARIATPADRCAGVIVSSKTIVEFLEYLGCGDRASSKRIPDSVLRSPRSMVLAFLQGLFLDGYGAWMGRTPKAAICVDSPALLDDLQVVLTNLRVVHSRITKRNRQNGKSYDEVYATGEAAQRLLHLVPFLEPDKAAKAAELLAVTPSQSTADLVPGITPKDLLQLIPRAERGRSRTEFGFLNDPRTRHVSRRTLQRVAAIPGVELPHWLQLVIIDDLHFSPVERVADAGEREVYDVSVPLTHAFVGNGIVNHNTINMPEEATVEEVEDLHIEAWKLGIKAIAIYRDNCKVAQPLSTQKKTETAVRAVERPGGSGGSPGVPGGSGGSPGVPGGSGVSPGVPGGSGVSPGVIVETIVLQEPVRRKLPRKRNSKTFSFRVADCHGYATVGEYDDGRPGEIFLKVAKQGSTMAGIMDAFAISVSHGLQFGVPLKAFVEMFINMRFEPAGITDDPEIRLAASLVDYIFRRLAVEYLPYEDRVDLGILTVGERTQPTLPGVEEASIPPEPSAELSLDLTDAPGTPPPAVPGAPTAAPGPQAAAVPEGTRRIDAPYCYNCGMEMQRAGSCYVCSSCGATSGCS